MPRKSRAELWDLWQKYRIDPDVARRVREFADEGKSEEASGLAREYVASHPGIQEALQYSRQHPEEAVPWREVRAQQPRRRGRKRV